jgi:aminoglycoside phosphotransferase (APT) family kinase protein
LLQEESTVPSSAGASDTTAMRSGEELDGDSLARYLRRNVAGFGAALEIEQFPGGHSNLTYLLRSGGRELVLRRPPLGPVAPRAHDMAREFRVLEALSPHFAPAPTVIHLCADESVIGAVFYLMERRRGVVLRQQAPPEFSAQPAFPQRTSLAFIDCLAQLHSIDIFKHGLVSLGRPEGFLARQVDGWTRRWERAKTGEILIMDRVGRWLHDHLPPSQAATVVHNDFKLDNIMLDPANPGRVVAVLDWEMTSVGDPLIDLGIVMCYWPEAGDPLPRRNAISPLTTRPGWMSRAELMKRYHEKTGFDLARMRYYEVFGLFKLAVVLQQIYYRYRAGQTSDERFRDFDSRVRGLAESAGYVMSRPQ